jgi:hypothetical protein
MTEITIRKLEAILAEARRKRTWGEVVVVLKDGKPALLHKTYQERIIEEEPYEAAETSKRSQ